MAGNDDLLDCEEDLQPDQTVVYGSGVGVKKEVKGTSPQKIVLKLELFRAVQDCNFERPSEVQCKCIPQAVKGMDILCQAKSGMGKTAVFVLATLQQLQTTAENHVYVLVMCHTRELALQITEDFVRLSKYMPQIKVGVFSGGYPIQRDMWILQNDCPHIVVGTPGRILSLINNKTLNLKWLKHFVLDECDKMLQLSEMWKMVKNIWKKTPEQKQVLMFCSTLPKESRPNLKRLMHDPMEVYVDDAAKLTPPGLQQHYVKLKENEKNGTLLDLLLVLEFNKVVIFVKSVERCITLSKVLADRGFPNVAVHGGMMEKERAKYQEFKERHIRILVATNLFARGMDIREIEVVFNYDMPEDSDTYLHRVARAGRFGTYGLAITFISDGIDEEILKNIEDRFRVKLNDDIQLSSYIEAR